MKHVREQLPDVQLRRPEVSSALAAVVDRATAKDLDAPLRRRPRADRRPRGGRWRSRPQRSGQATGEATAVLRTLPPATRRRLPARILHPVPCCSRSLLIARRRGRRASCCSPTARSAARGSAARRQAARRAAAACRWARAARTTSTRRRRRQGAPERGVAPSWTTTRHDVDDRELPGRRFAARQDGRRASTSTPSRGVGRPALDIRTPKTGWEGTGLRRPSRGPPPTLDGWQRRRRDCTITKKRSRSRSTPPGSRSATTWSGSPSCRRGAEKAEISEIVLYR